MNSSLLNPQKLSSDSCQAVLVHIDFHELNNAEYLTEFRELALAAGMQPVALIRGARTAPDAKYFVGSGKALEIKKLFSSDASSVGTD